MTVSESLVTWLYEFGDIAIDERVSTDQLDAAARSMGLYATPRTKVTEYMDGSRSVTAYYTFLVRAASQDETSRQSNQAWLERLQAWVRARHLSRTLPTLGAGKTCNSVAIVNTFYAQSQTEEESIYQMTLSMEYIEERTV